MGLFPWLSPVVVFDECCEDDVAWVRACAPVGLRCAQTPKDTCPTLSKNGRLRGDAVVKRRLVAGVARSLCPSADRPSSLRKRLVPKLTIRCVKMHWGRAEGRPGGTQSCRPLQPLWP